MRLIDADAFADVLIDVVKSKNYESLALDKALTAADCLNAIVAELKGTGIEGFKNCPTVDLDSSGSLVGYLTTNQYAAKYNINIHTVRQWCYRGMIDHVKVGGVRYIKDEAMPAYKYGKRGVKEG